MSNEGYTHLYPMETFKERLKRAVRLGELSLHIPLAEGKTPKKNLTVINISARGTFDFLCYPCTLTTTKEAFQTTLQTTTYGGSDGTVGTITGEG